MADATLTLLDERKKTLAEELLKGTPRTHIAKELGVDRTTLYKWMQEPEFQAYFEKLGRDLDEARSARLMVTVAKMAEVTETYLDYVLEELKTAREHGDRDRIAALPGMETITTALKRMVEIERLDTGRPTAITENRKKSAKTEDTPEASATKKLLDRLVSAEEPKVH